MKLDIYRPELDFELLYEFFTDEADFAKISFPAAIHGKNDFREYLERKLHTTWRAFFILQNDAGERIGFAFSHDHRENSCYLSEGIFKKYRAVGYGPMLGFLMLRYLFMSYPINRVFENVFDYNRESLAMHSDAKLFEKNGYLPDIRFYNGEWHGMYIFSITRAQALNSKLYHRLERRYINSNRTENNAHAQKQSSAPPIDNSSAV